MTVQLTIRMIRCYQGYAKMIYVCTIVDLPTFSTSKISGSECTGGTGASLNVSNKTDEECFLPLRYKSARYSFTYTITSQSTVCRPTYKGYSIP
jgi:hypothetical protein